MNIQDEQLSLVKKLLLTLETGPHTYEYYQELLNRILHGPIETLYAPYTMDNISIFRARLKKEDNSIAKNIGEIWYPKTISENRFNKHKPIFYCGNSIQTVLSETSKKFEGAVVTVIELTLNEPNPIFNPIGYSEVEKVEFSIEKDKLLHDFFCEVVKRDFDKHNDCYFPTQILADSILDFDFKGIIYDSVATHGNGCNYALNPKFIDENWRFKKAYVFEIFEMNSQVDFKFRCQFYANTMSGDSFDFEEVFSCPGHGVKFEESITK